MTPAFDFTGRYLAVSRGRTSIDLFDATTLQPIRSIPLGVQGLPYRAGFDPAGTRLGVLLDTEGILVYDVATGRPLLSPLPAEFSTDFTFIDATTVAVANAAHQRALLWHLDPRASPHRGVPRPGRQPSA